MDVKEEFNNYFKPILKKVNKIVIKKKVKYPWLDINKIRKSLLTWTRHQIESKQAKNITEGFAKALILFETACNMAKEKLKTG